MPHDQSLEQIAEALLLALDELPCAEGCQDCDAQRLPLILSALQAAEARGQQTDKGKA